MLIVDETLTPTLCLAGATSVPEILARIPGLQTLELREPHLDEASLDSFFRSLWWNPTLVLIKIDDPRWSGGIPFWEALVPRLVDLIHHNDVVQYVNPEEDEETTLTPQNKLDVLGALLLTAGSGVRPEPLVVYFGPYDYDLEEVDTDENHKIADKLGLLRIPDAEYLYNGYGYTEWTDRLLREQVNVRGRELRTEAFLMGLSERLGRGSRVVSLPREVARIIGTPYFFLG